MSEPLYHRVGNRFEPSEYVRGPWSLEHCHAGPPAGLITTMLAAERPDMAFTRVTCEIPAPIPLGPVRITTTVVRPGRRISLLRAEMTGLDGTVFMYASAWMMRQDDSIVGPATSHDDRMPPLDDATPLPINFWGDRPEFGDVVDTRTAEGSPFSGNGRASMWARLTAPLLADRAWNPYARAITIADFPNGVASIEPIDRLVAINTDVSAYFGRAPQGEWIGLRSGTNSSGLGLGMTESLLYDASGFVGTANQSIFFDRVSPPGTTR